ncbi:radical SAM protein [Actinophytocola xinjiangensis]|uniref:Radical SAM protein n=1 Tax=Actinophytocola xinjiangensis TaxID=485602 RepID=A0A7Z1AV84_9PSEU|nr:radical SAM protein [Actinophytocola xinjiangensis]
MEITGKCPLTCVHCYADSGPRGSHGAMTTRDWCRVIDESAKLGIGMAQFIGGEPTVHPDLARLVNQALGHGIEVEVYSNLVHVRSELWDVFTRPGVRLATSYYADDATQHEAITGRQGSHARTRNNIIEALRRSIPLRVGIVDIDDGQRVDEARDELVALGVHEIGYDRLRQVGRGIRTGTTGATQLCGNCASGVLAVSPDGTVWPCVFARWLPVGNVREQSLAEIVAGQRLQGVRAGLTKYFALAPATTCDPRCEPYTAGCHPECGPACSPRCDPVSCRPNCLPPRR